MRERAPKLIRGPVPRNREDDQVVYIDNDSAPRILFSGEDLLLEDLPIGTRVIYPKPPLEGLANPGAAIRYALNHPLEAEPLYAQLAPGMRVTIAVDDISLPLPPMATPGHPADDPRDRAGAARRERRRRRPHHHRQLAAPPDDRRRR